MKIEYQGQKNCRLTHLPSGSQFQTDAPRDNQGKGEHFSPTDLMGAALGSCILTTMAIVGEPDGLRLEGATAEVQKHMVADPRRIGSLPVQLNLPASLTPEQRKKMEYIASHCPVHHSLHPDIKIELTFRYV